MLCRMLGPQTWIVHEPNNYIATVAIAAPLSRTIPWAKTLQISEGRCEAWLSVFASQLLEPVALIRELGSP